jgi:hypothetical protein
MLHGMARSYYLKQLRLLPAETASTLGLPAEAPTFVSPILGEQNRCSVCPVTYTPLCYQVGYVTYAQHYHESGGGGVYCYRRCRPGVHEAHIRETGWISEVQPLGALQIQKTGREAVARAEAVRCLSIAAWCLRDSFVIRCSLRETHPPHPLESGLLFLFQFSPRRHVVLLPICDLDDQEELPVTDAPLRFTIRHGEVFFVQRDQR